MRGRLTHSVGTVNLGQLHAADDETGYNLAGALDDGVLGSVHVEAAHAAQLLDALHADEALDGKGTHRAVVARRGDDERGVDGVGVHAGLVVVVHGDEGPVGHDTRDADALVRGARDEVLDAGGVEELDVGQLQHLGHDRRGKERGVLDDDVVALVLVRDANLAQKGVGRLAHDHGGEELAAEPSTTAGRDGGLNDGNLEVGPLLAEDVGGAEAAGAGADDDNVRLGVGVEVLEVAARHGARDLALADGGKLEAVPLANHVVNGRLRLVAGTVAKGSGLETRGRERGDLLGRGDGGGGGS